MATTDEKDYINWVMSKPPWYPGVLTPIKKIPPILKGQYIRVVRHEGKTLFLMPGLKF